MEWHMEDSMMAEARHHLLIDDSDIALTDMDRTECALCMWNM